ncbi:unnamed protein product [Musa acuminata subsp. malaccensis]|uniref:(wild Malaysian banana) hypothetical protein n=1 Tax=Musa acuminata subsp. malaccensis TaxID=214687 RepID=A0A8D7AEW3_MUSAM|nr:unnamed protein product [Musa acuminata subsp. malaccensis]
MALSRGIRSGLKLLSHSEAALPRSGGSILPPLNLLVTHEFHATSMKRMGGHGHDEPFYVHAKHMYNLDRMKHQKLKVTLGVLSAFSIGVVVPIYAVIFQQKKAASG